MLSNEALIDEVRKKIEIKTGWGESADWTNQDFVALSEKIQEQTGVAISHVTLKRIWGKVKYESLPNTHTLNTLVQYLGYENWRDFSVKHTEGSAPAGSSPVEPQSESDLEPGSQPEEKKERRMRKLVWMVAPL